MLIRMYAWHNSTDFQPFLSAFDAALLAKCMVIGYTLDLSEYRNAIVQIYTGHMAHERGGDYPEKCVNMTNQGWTRMDTVKR